MDKYGWTSVAFQGRRKFIVLAGLFLSLTISVLAFHSITPLNLTSTSPWKGHRGSRNPVHPLTSNPVAAIIENRPLTNLIPLILHFAAVLGPDWPIIIFTSLNTTNIKASAPFERALASSQIRIHALPPQQSFTSHRDVSAFLTGPWFWEQLAPASHVLLFQSDSIICANAEQKMEDFLQYDFVGAPIASGLGQGYNGGLSLRNREMCLNITRNNSWEEMWQENADLRKQQEEQKHQQIQEEQAQHEASQEGSTQRRSDIFPDNPAEPFEDYEDQWFFKRMTELPLQLDGRPGANLPSEEIAKTFAVETVYHEQPLGYHQPGVFIADKISEIEAWCPEYRLTSGKGFNTWE
ncbi:MAG: hypothetical protein M1818_007116 [Claussenomyces sp. TS43310]|nr:MAG: hypothetical protein M1818_007116 [Claussenomyces sp. TS43310]